jgi:hypothetical protein
MNTRITILLSASAILGLAALYQMAIEKAPLAAEQPALSTPSMPMPKGATALTAAPDATSSKLGEATSPVATGGLPLKWGKPVYKTPSTFKVNGNEEIDVTAAEGTRVRIPVNAIVRQDGSPATGLIQLEIQEYYELTDFLNARLDTRYEAGLLESGGTVKVDAFEGKEPLKLAEGKEYSISFRVQEQKPGMTSWSLDTATKIWRNMSEPSSTTFEYNPEQFRFFMGSTILDSAASMDGEVGWNAFLELHQRYPEDAAKQGITGKATFEVSIDSAGRVTRVDPLSYDFPSFAYEGVRLLRSAAFAPMITCDGDRLASKPHITLQFPHVSDKAHKPSEEYLATFEQNWKQFKPKPFRSEAQWIVLRDRLDKRVKEKEQEWKDWVRRNRRKDSFMQIIRQISMPAYAFGWANCDQPTARNASNSTFVQEVRLSSPSMAQSFYALAFLDRQVLAFEGAFSNSHWEDRKVLFNTTPLRQRAILIRMEVDDRGQLIAGVMPFITGGELEAPDHLEPLQNLQGVLGKVFNPKGVEAVTQVDWEMLKPTL